MIVSVRVSVKTNPVVRVFVEHLQQVCEHLRSDQELDLEALDEVSGGFLLGMFSTVVPVAVSGANILIKNAPNAMATLFGGRGG